MIGLIGYGNIGQAIANGLNNEVLISDIVKKTGFVSNTELTEKADVIFLCVKPEEFSNLAQEIKSYVKDTTLLISLSPTHSINDLEIMFNHKGVVRYMPNTSISVNKGVSIVSHNIIDGFETSMNQFMDSMNKLGYVHKVAEHLIASTIGVAGSGIAIVFELLESMGMAGIMNGLSKELSYQLAAETLIGAGEMYKQTKKHPAELRDQVCSPNGITIKAVSKLEEQGFRGAVLNAIKETM